MIGPASLRLLRVHLAALEATTDILDAIAQELELGPEDGELEGAVERAYQGLEALERRARLELEIRERAVQHSLEWS